MLDSLRFVQGAVAKKDFSPALTHFHIDKGCVKGYNGALALCGPIDLDITATPKALPFVKAIRTCKATTSLNVQSNGKLVIKSGKFKAFIECSEEGFPTIEPVGERIEVSGDILRALKKLQSFIAEDASRPWACGILLRGQSAYATNNACLAEYWLGYTFPVEVCIPKAAVAEIIRINEEPTAIQVCENSITFHFEGDRWLRTQLQDTDWPDIERILNVESDPKPVPAGFFEAVEDLVPFGDEIARLYFLNGAISTCPSGETGAIIELDGLPAEGCFSAHFLKLLGPVVTSIDLDNYPQPCAFFGENLRGFILGVRA